MPRETAKRTKNWMIPEEPLWDRRAVRSSWLRSCQDSILTRLNSARSRDARRFGGEHVPDLGLDGADRR